MKLEEFIALQRKRIDQFEEGWRKQSAHFPDEWPLEMNEGDWLEQLSFFVVGMEEGEQIARDLSKGTGSDDDRS